MKRLFIIMISGFALFTFSCNIKSTESYIINGEAKNFENGSKVYLKYLDEEGREKFRDTAIVRNESFTMKGSVEYPSVNFLSVDGRPGDFFFMLENSRINITVEKNILESVVTGSKSQKDLELYFEGMRDLQRHEMEIINNYRIVMNNAQTEKRDSLQTELDKITKVISEYPVRFVLNHPNSYFSLNLLGLESNKPNIDIVKFLEAFNNLDSSIKSSKKGISVKKKLDELFTAFEATEHLQIGKVAPNFEAPKPNGTIVSLDEVKSKITIISFWAAWSKTSRNENSRLKRVYEKYHDQGLEIISVSLDGQSAQDNSKKAWLEAIETDNLTWTQVSHLNYYNDPVARLYNIKTIPSSYILDSERKIVAKNLKGQALENKVIELLNK